MISNDTTRRAPPPPPPPPPVVAKKGVDADTAASSTAAKVDQKASREAAESTSTRATEAVRAPVDAAKAQVVREGEKAKEAQAARQFKDAAANPPTADVASPHRGLAAGAAAVGPAANAAKLVGSNTNEVARGADNEGADVSPRDAAIQAGLKPFEGQNIPDAAALEAKLAKTNAWKELTKDEKILTKKQLNLPGDEGKMIRAQTNSALNEPGFDKQKGEQQLQALEGAVFPRLPSTPAQALDTLKENDAYKALPAADQKRIANALGKPGWQADAMAGLTDSMYKGQPNPALESRTIDQLNRVSKSLDDSGSNTSTENKALSPQVKDARTNEMLYDRSPFAVSKTLEKLTKSDDFKKMTPAAQSKLIEDTAMALSPEPDAPPPPGVSTEATKSALEADPAYKSLDTKSKDELNRLTQGDNKISDHARARLGQLMKTDAYKVGDTATKQEMLKNLQHLGGLPYGVNNVTPSEKPNGTATVTDKRDVTAQFEQSQGPATEYDVSIKRGDRTFDVKVQMPKDKVEGMNTPTLDQVKDALTRLPDDQLNSLQKVVVNPTGEPGSGMSTQGDDGMVQILPAHTKAEANQRFEPGAMSEVLNHEVGHLQSITPWSNNESSAQWKKWDDATKKDGLSASDYAKTNGPEDFAESYALYRSAENRPKEMAEYRKMFPNRFAIIDNLVKTQNSRRSR